MDMDNSNLASGDCNSDDKSPQTVGFIDSKDTDNKIEAEEANSPEITPQAIEDNEKNLKERIAQCRGIIESLKSELSEEKSKLEKEARYARHADTTTSYVSELHNHYHSDTGYGLTFSANIESRLNCDESLIEYEKQLLRYQNTLTMAQMEKKNAIKKQMLAKAYKLKLLEVENQCNMELLRVKQSLQCLEPLQAAASKWKIPSDDYDYNSFDLMPMYSELSARSGSDVASLKDEDAKSSGKSGNNDEGFSFNLSL